MDDDALYRHFRLLAESVPKLPNLTPDPSYSAEDHRWLGRLEALIEEAFGELEAEELRFAISDLSADIYSTRIGAANDVRSALFRGLARAELRAPPGLTSSFIAVGNAFDALRALAEIMKKAGKDVLIVDPYMDEVALTDVAILTDEGVSIRLLGDEATVKPSFKPAVKAWAGQYGAARPLEARLAKARTLHDRLIVTDEKVAWVLTQSLKDLAKRSPATLTTVPPETASLKIAAYAAIWNASSAV